MNTIVDLSRHFKNNKVKVKESCGWYLIAATGPRNKHERWTMLDDNYYRDGLPMKKKDVDNMFKVKKNAKT